MTIENSMLEEVKMQQTKKIEIMKSSKKQYYVNVLGKEIIVLPHVFYPEIDTELLIQSVRPNTNDRILEPFAGTGAIGIFMAQTAQEVIATDINQAAVKNIQENIQLYGLTEKMSATRADIFPSDKKKFDVIIANPPYSDTEAHDEVEKAFWDSGHQTVKRFFQEAKNYLNRNGKIYCSWSNFADFAFIEKLAQINNYNIKKVSEVSKNGKIFRVYEIKRYYSFNKI